MRHVTGLAVALALAGLAARVAAGTPGSAQDDLAVVKKAVASPSPGKAAAPGKAARVAAATADEPRPVARPGREPQWFKVRVVEKGTHRNKVTINLPLSLVRALGDEPIDWGCHDEAARERCHTIRISDILRSLEAGQELVEIDDDEATVRVWVE